MGHKPVRRLPKKPKDTPSARQRRDALVNIRMEIQDAEAHYTPAMHKRMMALIDEFLALADK
jgi:hypothetical protein